MLDANFFRFLGTNLTGHMFECLDGRCSVIMNLLDFNVGFGWQTQILWNGLNHNENRIRCDAFQQIIDGNVVLNK
jgi:hypothetical protein